jgi:hypothetical protein
MDGYPSQLARLLHNRTRSVFSPCAQTAWSDVATPRGWCRWCVQQRREAQLPVGLRSVVKREPGRSPLYEDLKIRKNKRSLNIAPSKVLRFWPIITGSNQPCSHLSSSSSMFSPTNEPASSHLSRPYLLSSAEPSSPPRCWSNSISMCT